MVPGNGACYGQYRAKQCRAAACQHKTECCEVGASLTQREEGALGFGAMSVRTAAKRRTAGTAWLAHLGSEKKVEVQLLPSGALHSLGHLKTGGS